ncbi:porin [Dechloromonas sp. XY25]|uniref:Porin n=1 Tax=Dechloromonas hankyongensis TaxID=2908002 RepID=A0ABS9K7E6_9RHOO|nr:porin [Dechloromonas hankyongensis]MCG2579071.1 porin [Dechloromonas hankyongensis]
MQKKVIALAIAAMTSGAALAQSNVTIYGTVDMGYLHRGGANGAVPTTKGQNDIQGNSAQSSIGFKGVEDLGNGLKAVFDLQYRINADTNTGLAQAGHQYVGLTGGFGTAVAGYLDGLRYGIYGKYTPAGNYSVGNFASMTTQYDRAANAVAYISPSFAGFTLILAHATNTQVNEGGFRALRSPSGGGNDGDDRLYSINLVYANGPLSVDLDYETTKAVGISDSRLYVATAGASYDFGVVKVSGLYDVIKGDPNSLIGGRAPAGLNLGGTAGTPSQEYDRRNWQLGVTVPFGATKVLASYGKVQDKILSDADASKWSVGARYALSKRTELYADYAHIHNERNAAYLINPMGNNSGTSVGVHGVDIGIKHSF